MTSGISLFLIAVGAILYFAVNASVSGLEIDTVGLILMIVGAVGFLWSMLVLYGVRDLVVVVRGGLTLVTTKESAADLKTLISKLPPDIRDRE